MTTPTDHNDSVSGQPYSPPPWDPNRLPPPTNETWSTSSPVWTQQPKGAGGDGGGGKKKHRKWPWIVGGIAVLAVIGSVAGANSGDPAPKVALPTATQAPYPTPPPEQKEANASASHAPKAPPAPTVPELTAAQENAIESAKSYLEFTGFSRSGLIKQLVDFDEYSTADATFAVDHLKTDYKAQAVRSARAYLDFTGFSRSGLVKQLVEFDGYTRAQAVYAADKVGL